MPVCRVTIHGWGVVWGMAAQGITTPCAGCVSRLPCSLHRNAPALLRSCAPAQASKHARTRARTTPVRHPTTVAIIHDAHHEHQTHNAILLRRHAPLHPQGVSPTKRHIAQHGVEYPIPLFVTKSSSLNIKKYVPPH